MTKEVGTREHSLALGGHANVTIDEIDMSKETPTDALDLFKYGCRLAPQHAFVNICCNDKRISAEAKRNE